MLGLNGEKNIEDIGRKHAIFNFRPSDILEIRFCDGKINYFYLIYSMKIVKTQRPVLELIWSHASRIAVVSLYLLEIIHIF